ncbi:hypothetical protein TI03_00460 [Achromatium sp. WMS1]|nr:hypothetical protein TI03_00460 [Achromatium sp. WMS1]
MSLAAEVNFVAPHTYPQRILLMVTGRSPQVITETIYALCCKQDPPFIPTEVQIITTSEGADDVRHSLLSEEPGWFAKLRKDWNLPEIRFGSEQIHILTDNNGQLLSDIRTHEENDQAADFIVDKVRKLAENKQCALHVSLAGGRKTMGYFLGYALSLYGRPQDRLSHVLVNPPFESNRDFFYPTPNSRIIYTYHPSSAQQRPVDAKDGQVTLANIPFVRLRDSLSRSFKGLQIGTQSFSEVVNTAQQALEPASVIIDYVKQRVLVANNIEIKFRPADLAFYGWLAKRQQRRQEPVQSPPEKIKDTDKPMFSQYKDEYFEEAKHAEVQESTGIELKGAQVMTEKFFTQRKAGIKKRLELTLGPLATSYDITCFVKGSPGRPGKYGLDIEPERIQFLYD